MSKVGFKIMIEKMDTDILERLLETYILAFNEMNPTMDLYFKIEKIIEELSNRYVDDNE